MSSSPEHVDAARIRQSVSSAPGGAMTGVAVSAVTGMRKQGVIAKGHPAFFLISTR